MRFRVKIDEKQIKVVKTMAETERMMAVRTRINELAAKAKTPEGLTDDEIAERAELRTEFLDNFKAAFRSQVEMLQVFDENGNEVTPERVKDIQRDKGLRDN